MHDLKTNENVLKYINMMNAYVYVCKWLVKFKYVINLHVDDIYHTIGW